MGASPELSTSAAIGTDAHVPRAQVIAQAWAGLGPSIAGLSNGSGRPLARTVKLILEPLVIRPVQNPHLAGSSLSPAAARELSARIGAAAEDLCATAEWFAILKSARRALGITDGNPQERYFQRCFELARTEGPPDADDPTTHEIATATVAEIAQADGASILNRIREVLLDPSAAAELEARLAAAWSARRTSDTVSVDAPRVAAVLEACATNGRSAADFAILVDESAGTSASGALADSGAARLLGLTEHDDVPVPRLGSTASKRDLPRPFDRSVYERLFAALAGGAPADVGRDAEDILHDEVARCAAPWELASESDRVVMLLGAEASHALEPADLLRPTAAHRHLRDRWQREAYVRRVHRLPSATSGVPEAIAADVHAVRQGYLRRLWVRLHGRELRGTETAAADLWDTLDGVLRSVIMDQRHRLKAALGRVQEGAA